MAVNFVTLSAKLEADAAAFNRQLATARKSVDELGSAIQRQNQVDKQNAERAAQLRRQSEAYTAIGGAITRYVTLPLALAGGAAVKMGADVEIGFSRLVGLAGVPAKEVGAFREQLEGISKQTATTIPDLVHAAYIAASVGFRGAEGIDVLTRSAKASAAGLGDAATVTKIITAAVNSYGKENLTAAQAADALVAAVRVGGAEADELASSLGNVLSVSKAAGVSFQDTAAAVAALTAAGAQTDIAITGVRNAIQQFIDPAPEARKQLEALGISVDGVRKTLRDKGLLEALFELKDVVAGNAETLSKIFPDMRGLVQVLNLLGQSPQAAIAAFNQVRDSTGALDEAFKAFKATAASQLKQALVDSQAELIKLGNTLLPLAADVLPPLVSGFSSLVDAFNSIPGPIRTTVVAIAAVGALSGPLLTLAGNLKRIGAGIIEIGRSSSDVSSKVSALRSKLAGVASLGAIGVTIGLTIRAGEEGKASKFVDNIVTAAGDDIRKQLTAVEKQLQIELGRRGKGIQIPIGFGQELVFDKGARQAADRIGALQQKARDLWAEINGAANSAKIAGGAFAGMGDGATEGAHGVDALIASLDKLDKQSAFQNALDKLNEVAKVDPYAEAERSAINLRQAQLGLLDAQDRYNTLLSRNVDLEQRRVDLEQRRAALTLDQARQSVLKAQDDLERLSSSGAGTPRQIADAQLELRDAQLRVDESSAALAESQKAAAQAGRDLERASLDVQAAELAVKEARASLVSVSQAEAQKQKDLEQAFRDLVRLGSDPAAVSADDFKNKLIELRNTFPTLAGPINDVLTLIATAKAAVPQLVGQGPLLPGQTYAPNTFVGGTPTVPTLSPEAVAYIKGVTGTQPPTFSASTTTETGGSTVPGVQVNIGTIVNPDAEQVASQIDQKLRTYRLVGGAVQ